MGAVETFWKPYIYEQLLRVCPQILTWRERNLLQKKFSDTLRSADNEKIPRHPEAGTISEGYQIMHNGLRIVPDCYSGPTNRGMLTELFRKNKGVHEPAEEFAFQVLLETLPDSATIVELGAWWAFYSMWFCTKVKNPVAYLIEPERDRMEFGKRNFALNKFKGHFFNYFIGATSGFWQETKRSLWAGTTKVETKTLQISIDDFVAQNKISFIDVLHSDIQGAEVDMLRGAERTIDERKIRYFCISTHSVDLHKQCLEFLIGKKYVILCEADLHQSMHMDGFLVARAAEMPGPDSIAIDKNRI